MTDKTDREIMQMALEALYSAPLDHNSIKSRFFERRHHAIIALRERLAKPDPRNQCGETCERAKLCAVCLAEMGAQPDPLQRLTDVQQEIEAALAQPEQKPVACIVKGCSNHRGEGLFIGALCSPCHTFITTGEGKYSQAYRNSQREWQGLTDQELHETEGYEEDRKLYRFARAVEAKLKEKND